MALQHTKLNDIQRISSTVGSIYANPASTKSYIRSLVLFNSHTSDVTVKLYDVPDASGALGIASAANQILEKVFKSKETFEFGLFYPVTLTDANDAIFAEASVNNVVNVVVNGDKDV